jgi:cell division protein FtsN
MARDYAARNKRPARKPAGLPGWVWMIAGLSLGLAVAVFVYISRPTQTPLRGTTAAMQVGEPETAGELVNGKKMKSSEAQDIAERQAKSAKPAAKVEPPPKEKPRFTFYELLPNQEVLVPGPSEPAGARPGAPPPTRTTPGESFIIQVASYRSESEADKQKASLALIGLESRIEKVTIDNRDTYYRVRVGPLADERKARETLAQLEANGINGMLVKLK